VSEELFAAIAAGDAETVGRLVAKDATLAGCRNEEGISARMLALYRSDVDMLEALVDSGPDLDVFEAAGLGAEERLDELLSHEPALLQAHSADGFTALHFAAFFGHPGAARLLVERGADVSDVAQNPMRVQPLHSAAAAACREIVELLLDHGADPNAQQEGGFVALDAARQNGDDELEALLTARGAEPKVAKRP
jgi:ankyrin repeat protein